MAQDSDFRDKLSNLSDEELMKVVYFESEDYTEEAHDAAYQLFNERWVTFDQEKRQEFEEKINILNEKEKRLDHLLDTHVLEIHGDKGPRELEEIAEEHFSNDRPEKGEAYISYILYRWPGSDVAHRLLQDYEDDGFGKQLEELVAVYSEKEKQHLEGIGGWLYIVAIGVIVAPFKLLFALTKGIETYSASRNLDVLSDPFLVPNKSSYQYFMALEVVVWLALIGASVYILYLFFMKKRAFPKWYIGISLFSFGYICFSVMIASGQLNPGESLDSNYIEAIVRSLVKVCIWVPYMLKSERVKVTFVE